MFLGDNDDDDDDDAHLTDENSSLKHSSSNSASSNSKKAQESLDESNGRMDELLRNSSVDYGKESADGCSSSSRELAELTTCCDVPRISARSGGEREFDKKSPVSKSSSSSFQLLPVGDNTHSACKTDTEEVEILGLVASTSEGKFVASDTGMRFCKLILKFHQ